jgi:hypothetical protein
MYQKREQQVKRLLHPFIPWQTGDERPVSSPTDWTHCDSEPVTS